MDEQNGGDQDGSHNGKATVEGTARNRRKFLKIAGSTAVLTTLAGCSSQGSNSTGGGANGTTRNANRTTIGQPTTGESPSTETASNTSDTTTTTQEPLTEDDLLNIDEWRGSGPVIENRPDRYESGVSIQDLPDLSGDLTLYLGGGEGGLYQNLMKRFEKMYDGFSIEVRLASSSQLANTIIEEVKAGNSPADIFWAIDAGSIGIVSSAGATVPLPDRVTSEVPDTYAPTGQWVGTMGRARCITYNTNDFSEKDIPNDISAFPTQEKFNNAMGWAPTYGAFQSFITAMRLLKGEDETRAWLNGMQEQGIKTYDNELRVANAVARGELSAGFTNHYYSRLVFEERPNAPIKIDFTKSDAGSLVNCSGTEIIKGTQNKELAANFIHHLLSIEAQEFLCTRGYEYPLVPSVPPVGDLPTIDKLNPPKLNLAKLSDLEPTLQLLRETGAL
jgi:iron(III) transport system substrate-binding protein